MARDVRSIARTLGARTVDGRVAWATPIDAAVRLEEFTVVGHPGYATLVIDSADAIAAALRAGDRRAEALTSAVLVADAGAVGGASLLATLEEAGATGVIVDDAAPELLHAQLVALLAEDQAAEDRLVTTGTKVLTQVARRGGPRAVVAELARRIDGWAVLLDPHGHVITTAGAGGLHVRDAVSVAFNRPVRVRHPGLQVHPVGREKT